MPEPNLYAPPTTDLLPLPPLPPTQPDPAAGASTERGLSPGVRIAGGLLILNAILVLIEKLALATPDQGAFGVAPLIDLVIGGCLLAGRTQLRPWAIVRAALGGVVFTGMHLAAGHTVPAVLQVAVSGALLMLLVGPAGLPRTIAGSAVFGLYFVLSSLGLLAALGGANPLGAAVARVRYDIESKASTEVSGVALDWRLSLPAGRWHLRRPQSARKDNPLADRWLVRPDQDAHLVVIAERLAGVGVSLDSVSRAVVSNARAAATDLKVLDQEPLGAGRLIHTQATVHGLRLEYYYGVFVDGASAYQVIGFAEQGKFASVAPEMKQILASFAPAGS